MKITKISLIFPAFILYYQVLDSQNINSIKYFHDNANRITEVHNSDCSYVSYCYDPDGNRVCKSRTYIPDPNGLVSFARCGEPNGYIELEPLNGGNYKYMWSNGETNLHIYNLKAGIYYLSITDLNNQNNFTCIRSYEILQLPHPVTEAKITATGNTSFCEGGFVELKASIGTDYTYQWFRNGNIINGANSYVYQANQSGNYTVEITKDFCSLKSSGLQVTVFPPPGISATTYNVSCNNGNDGKISANGKGGTAPYQYSLDNVNYQVSGIFSNLSSGNYNLFVKDFNGCIDLLQVQIDQPMFPILANITTTNIVCFGQNNGSITVSGSGGTPPYLFSLNNSTPVSNGFYTNLSSGSYAIKVIDSRNCTFAQNVSLIEPTPLIASSIVVSNVKCNGGNDGSIIISGSGGSPPYKYKLNANLPVLVGSFTSLTAGSNVITITDSHDCSYTQQIFINEPLPLIVDSILALYVKCKGGNDGSILVAGKGGTPPYRYSLNGGNPTVNRLFSNLKAGSYVLKILDSNDCSLLQNVQVAEPTSIICNILNQLPDDCFPLGTGSVRVNSSGGIGTILYSIDNGINYQSSGLFTSLNAGTYIVKSKDSNGCIIDLTINIIKTPPQNDLMISFNGSTLTSPYSNPNYWYIQGNPNPIDSGKTHICNQDGSFYSVGIDLNGCTATSKIIYINCITASNDISNISKIRIFPNPTTKELNIRGSGINNGIYTFSLKDLTGQSVTNFSISVENNLIKKQVSLSEIANGFYMLVIDSGNERATIKIEKIN